MAGKPRGRWRWPLQLGLVLVVFILLHQWRSKPLAHGDAPSLSGPLLRGGHFDLTEPRDKPMLVHFWATWCPLCEMGDQGIQAIAEDFPVITVALQSGNHSAIAAHMDREGLGFPVIADPYGELATAWGVQGVPASFVVDSRDQIRFSTMGYSTESGLRARLWAVEALD